MIIRPQIAVAIANKKKFDGSLTKAIEFCIFYDNKNDKYAEDRLLLELYENKNTYPLLGGGLELHDLLKLQQFIKHVLEKLTKDAKKDE